MSALDRNDMEDVRSLLAHGADVNEPGSYRITPLISAGIVLFGRGDVVMAPNPTNYREQTFNT